MGGVLAVKNKQSFLSGASLEQLIRQLIFIIDIDSSFNMATFILVLKSAIDDDWTIVALIVFTIKNFDHGMLCNTR